MPPESDTERRERAAEKSWITTDFDDWAAYEAGFLAGCEHEHKTTIAVVVAWLRNEADGRDDPPALADAIERGEAEGAAGHGRPAQIESWERGDDGAY